MSLTAAGFLGLYLVGLVLAFVRHPSYGLFSYVWAFYNLPPSRWWGSELPDVRWSLVAAATTVVALAVHSVSGAPRAVDRRARQTGPEPEGASRTWPRLGSVDAAMRAPWLRSWGSRLLLAFVAWMWLQTIWSVSPERNIDGALLYTKYAVLSYLLYSILTDALTLERFCWLHVLGCFLWGWIGYTTNTSGRWEVVLGPGIDDSNVLGFHLVTGLAFAGFLFLTVSGTKRWLAFAAIPFILNGVILTASRSTLLGLFGAGAAALVFAPRARRAAAVGSLLLAVPLLLLLARNELFWIRASSLGETREAAMDSSAASRIAILRANWQMALDYPFGAGHQGSELLSPRYVPEELLTEGRRSAHNTLMAVLVDEGFPGLMIFVSLHGWLLVRLLRLHRRNPPRLPLSVSGCRAAVAAGLVAFAVAGLFMNLFKAEVVLWLLAIVPVIDALSMTTARKETA